MLTLDPFLGTRFEKCVVERLIGRGGYGMTYLAFDEELQEHRVVKISQGLGENDDTRRRHNKSFIDEGLILSRLKHPQIVTLRGQGEVLGHRYMILDYIQGFSLKNVFDIVTRRQLDLDCRWEDLMDPVTASALILSTLYPMEYAHRANVHLPDREIFGVAHRDISPGNLILGSRGNEKGKVVVIDFGTAKTDLSENITVNQNLVGTVPYMSKARLQKSNAHDQPDGSQEYWRSFKETQNDIHALGVLYFQLLTGRMPFAGETTPQIIVKVLDPIAYTRCHGEIAESFAFASGVLEKCVVYHDFLLPFHQQPYQYPDALAMLADMEELFKTISQGKTPQEILSAFTLKLADPGQILPNIPRSYPSPVYALEMPRPAPPKPAAIASPPVAPRPRPGRLRTLILAVAVLGIAGLATAAWMLYRNAAVPARKPMAAADLLEKFDGSVPEASAAVSPPRKGIRPSRGEKPSGKPNPGRRTTERPETPPSPAPTVAGKTAQERMLNLAVSSLPEAKWDLTKEVFVQVQNQVREDNPSAFETLSAWLNRYPESPDLRLLRVRLLLERDPASPDARRDLATLQSTSPAFIHPDLFHENTLYLLWQADAAAYESQKTPAQRVRLLKSANAYLSEFQSSPAYTEKVKGIRDRLPK